MQFYKISSDVHNYTNPHTAYTSIHPQTHPHRPEIDSLCSKTVFITWLTTPYQNLPTYRFSFRYDQFVRRFAQQLFVPMFALIIPKYTIKNHHSIRSLLPVFQITSLMLHFWFQIPWFYLVSEIMSSSWGFLVSSWKSMTSLEGLIRGNNY